MKATNETKADFADAIAAIRAAADQNPEYPGKIKDIQRGKPEDRAVFRIPAPHSKGVIVSCEPWRQCINALADKLEKNARFFGGVRPTLKVSKVGDARGLTAARSAHAEGHYRAAARALGDRLIFTVRAERNPTFQPYCRSATCEVAGVEYSIGFAVFGTRKTMLVIHEPTGQFISARHLGHPRTEAEAIAALQSESLSKIMRSIADDIAAGKHPAFGQAAELAEYLAADLVESIDPEPIVKPEAAEATEATVTEGEHSAESFGYLEEMPCAPFQAPRRPAIEGYPTIAVGEADTLETLSDADTDECEDGDTVTVSVARTAAVASAKIAGHIVTESAPKIRARWNGSTWVQDSPPDDGGNSPPNAGMPTGEAGDGAGDDSPLESITIMRAEGLIDCPIWPAGETRTFHSFESATKGLRDICGSMEKDRPGYDKCDVTVQWRNGREYKYRFDATPDMRETPDVAQHIRDMIAFHCGAMRPSHMTREAYARFISDEHNRNWLQSLRDELDGCAFPLPLPDDCEPAPYGELRHGLRCYYKGWGPGGADSSEAIVTHVDERTDKYGYQYFNIITLDNPRVMQFLVSSLTGLRPSVILGDSYASDIETTRLVNAAKAADVQKAIKAADEKAQFSETVERLKAENPRLSKDRSVAQNIRASFKLAGIKASVRKDGHSCINITLADAGNLGKAEEIAFRFKAGHFDGMQDCYEYRRTPFTEAFGDVEYIFIN